MHIQIIFNFYVNDKFVIKKINHKNYVILKRVKLTVNY